MRLAFANLIVSTLLSAAVPASAQEPDRDPGPVTKVSAFIYRDVNRDGRYDTGDRPFAGVRAVLTGPRGESDYKSNVSGFANHLIHAGPPEEIRPATGTYRLQVTPPDGYEVTSGNGEQELHIVPKEQSPAGIVMDRPPRPVGIAPLLSISGRADCADRLLQITDPGGTASTISIGSDGYFHLAASRGAWFLSCTFAEGGTMRRRVIVDALPVYVAGWILSRAVMPDLRLADPAETVTFDDLTVSDTLVEIPNGYRGLDWSNFVAVHNKFYRGAGYVNATTSGEYVAYTSGGYPSVIAREYPFDVLSLDLSTAWRGGESYDIELRGLDDQGVVYRDRIRASSAGPLHVDLGYRDIRQFEIVPGGYWQSAIDGLAVVLN